MNGFHERSSTAVAKVSAENEEFTAVKLNEKPRD